MMILSQLIINSVSGKTTSHMCTGVLVRRTSVFSYIKTIIRGMHTHHHTRNTAWQFTCALPLSQKPKHFVSDLRCLPALYQHHYHHLSPPHACHNCATSSMYTLCVEYFLLGASGSPSLPPQNLRVTATALHWYSFEAGSPSCFTKKRIE